MSTSIPPSIGSAAATDSLPLSPSSTHSFASDEDAAAPSSSSASAAASASGSPTSSSAALSGKLYRGRWSPAEDALLTQWVEHYEGKNWKRIAESAFGSSKTDVQCLHRSASARLLSAVLPPSHELLPAALSLLTSLCRCLHRWQKVLKPGLIKGPWMKQEDDMVCELVARYGVKKWYTAP